MSKAVLVIDMPESCSKCNMYESGGYNDRLEPYGGACFLSKRCMHGHKVTKGKPDWCLLKPLPEKQKLTFATHGEDMITMGWNAAIEAIEGK